MHPGRFLFWCGALGVTMLLTPLRVVQVSGQSMMPTLRDGERYLMDRMYWRAGGLRRDDVIVLVNRGEELVKRLVGLPGDRLELALGPDNECYELANLTTGQKGRLTATPDGMVRKLRVKVPSEHYYVLGDNWWRSDDSRTFQSIPRSTVLGVLRTFSLNRSFPRREATTRQ